MRAVPVRRKPTAILIDRFPMPAHRGNSRAYLLKRLKHVGRSDLVQAVQAGRVDVFTAAVEAGLRKRAPSLEILTNARKRREFALHPHRATKDMAMWLGDNPHDPVFKTEKEACKYWRENRPRLWPLLAINGKRPWIWWCIESPIPWPGAAHQTSALYEANLLAEGEKAEVEASWRHEFNRSHDCRFFADTRARKAHLRWADVPAVLVREWERERRRSAVQIREMQENRASAPR